MEFERLELLIGDKIELFKKAKVLIVGIGGVGGYVLECLIRSGFENITLVDYDVIEYSNLNRQIIAGQDNIGKKKIEAAKERALNINPAAKITTYDLFLEAGFFEKKEFDYIVDACDTPKTKEYLIRYAIDNNIKIISSMGTGNRLNPAKLKITTLNKTFNDPLAKKMRSILKENKYLKTSVVFSDELPIKTTKTISSIILVPMVAGNLCAYYIIKDILNKE